MEETSTKVKGKESPTVAFRVLRISYGQLMFQLNTSGKYLNRIDSWTRVSGHFTWFIRPFLMLNNIIHIFIHFLTYTLRTQPNKPYM